eukprot:gene16767-30037_t
MCGLIAVLLADPDARACQLLYDGLTMLQHRGQDAAGMVTCDATAGTLHMRKSTGLVKEVFQAGVLPTGIGFNFGLTSAAAASSTTQCLSIRRYIFAGVTL